MSRSAFLSLLLLAASFQVPEAEDWPSYRGGPALQGVAPGSLAGDLELAWTFEAGGAITSSPVVAGGLVYFGSDDYHVYALDAATGEKRWSFATEDIIEAPPLVHEGAVYIGSSDYFFYALDAATGALRWKAETDDKILGSANWVRAAEGAGTWVVVGSYDTFLYCFEAKSGAKKWAYQTQNYVNGTPAIADGKIVFGGCDAALHVVSAATGEGAEPLELGSDCHVAGSVALAGGRAYFGHYGNAFVCVDLAEEKLVWAYESTNHAFFSSAAIGADRVVFGGRDKQVHCVERDTGEAIWIFRTGRKVDASPVIAGDKVVVGSGDGVLYVLALEDGAEVWKYEIGRSIFSSPAVVGGRIYVGANDSRLYCFGPRPAKDGEGGDG